MEGGGFVHDGLEGFVGDAGQRHAVVISEAALNGLPSSRCHHFVDLFFLFLSPSDGSLEPLNLGGLLLQGAFEIGAGRQGVVELDGTELVHETARRILRRTVVLPWRSVRVVSSMMRLCTEP